MIHRSFTLVPLLLVLLATSGCLKLEKARPEKRFFLIEAPRQGEAREAGSGVVQIRRFDVSPAFEAPSLVYRVGETSWESDYYHAFFIQPDVMLTELCSRWIASSGLFDQVAATSSQMRGDYLLEGNVVSLYGDYRPGRSAEAVVELQVLLLRDDSVGASVIAQGDYKVREPISGNAPEDLVEAWGRAMASLLGELEQDIAKALAAPPEGP